MSARGIEAARNGRWDVDLPREAVHKAIDEAAGQPWFKYALDARHDYWNCWRACFWLASRIDEHEPVLETGCGCGYNLIWFGQQGFTELSGFDNDDSAVATAHAIARIADLPVRYWIDDALSPNIGDQKYKVILALNWTYLVPDFDISRFFASYSRFLSPGGYIAIDVVDASYSDHPKNAICTQDWLLPSDKPRRPTEYPVRLSKDEVVDAAIAAGLSLCEIVQQPQTVPKVLYICQRDS